MIRRLFPYPLLMLSLILFWMMLNSFSLGHLLLGAVVAFFASRAMATLRPVTPKFKRWYLLPQLVLILLYDIVLSNIAVAKIILFSRKDTRKPGFVTVPLDLRNPMGLAVLSVVLTSTPGSAWLEYNSTQGTLLLHVLDNTDPSSWVSLIKNRYEKLLMEIFE